MAPDTLPIIICGAGIAGLTAALAFARRGRRVRLLERAPALQEVGAGLQLSPNATHILSRLGVLPLLMPAAVRPDAVVIRDAASLKELSRLPLGARAEQRWGAPYLTAHRADLQSALLARVVQEPDIELTVGAAVEDIAVHARGVTVSARAPTAQDGVLTVAGQIAIGADGVWSTIRGLGGQDRASHFSGRVAWRRTVRSDGPEAAMLGIGSGAAEVTAYLHAGCHVVAYPIRGGTAVNIAAFTAGQTLAHDWASTQLAIPLATALGDAAPSLRALAEQTDAWTAWPVHVVRRTSAAWTAPGGVALIGDAAHAMTPFAAQGAAMAIEDAETLAASMSKVSDPAAALAEWEARRRSRIARVARRGALNGFAWHASGLTRLARDLYLSAQSPQRLIEGLDWLYGWQPDES